MPRSTRTKKTRETIYIRLPVKIEYDTPAAREYAIKTACQAHIDECSYGVDGTYAVKSGTGRLIKEDPHA